MTLAEYQTLTGITVPSSKQSEVTASIARVQSILETMLGYSLDPDKVDENFYNELGQTTQSCFCPSVDLEDLDDPDGVEGAYRLFSYNELDKYFFIDPCTTVYKVKLVNIKPGDGLNGVTIKTFEDEDIRIQYGRDNIAKYIEYCNNCLCSCDCTDCVQLAVDADWLCGTSECMPLELQYVMADMITHYSNSKKDIKSESIDTHSYTKFNNVAPETESNNLAVIKRYAGPYGSVSVMPL